MLNQNVEKTVDTVLCPQCGHEYIKCYEIAFICCADNELDNYGDTNLSD